MIRHTSPTATSNEVPSTTCPMTRVTRPCTANRGVAEIATAASLARQSLIETPQGQIGAPVHQPRGARQGEAAAFE